MLVNHQGQLFGVKLTDIGLAPPASETEVGMLLQAPADRAPEVTLGLPITEAISMWGLECVLAYLYSGFHLFSAPTTYNIMQAIFSEGSEIHQTFFFPG